MWLFTRYGFYSASVQGRDVFIRARHHLHLANLIERFESVWAKEPEIITTPDADYRYRIKVDRQDWARIAYDLAAEQDWSNFKEQAELFASSEINKDKDKDEGQYIAALHHVWQIMYDYQNTMESIQKIFPGREIMMRAPKKKKSRR